MSLQGVWKRTGQWGGHFRGSVSWWSGGIHERLRGMSAGGAGQHTEMGAGHTFSGVWRHFGADGVSVYFCCTERI